MALSCLIGRTSLSALKGHSLNKLSREILKSSNAFFINRQPYHHQLSPIDSTKSCVLIKNKVQLNPFLTSVKLFAAPAYKGHDHSKLWTFERLLSFLLLPVLPAAFMYPSQELDTALAILVVMHSHFGLEAIVVDYVRPILFGNIIPKIGIALVYLFSIATLGGLLNIIYNDCGLANTIITLLKK